ncbi:hypothetical protein Tco_1203144 [Tanacetum coccineum]
MGSSDRCCFSCMKACFASDVQWKSLFLIHFFKVLNSGKDFSATLERNLFKLANFPLRLWTFLIVHGDGSCSTASVLSGHGFIPSGLLITGSSTYTSMFGPTWLSKALSTSRCSAWIAFARSGAWPLFFYRTGEYPSWILSRCSATDRGTPVIFDGYHANISRFSFRSVHSPVHPFADSVPPIATS